MKDSFAKFWRWFERNQVALSRVDRSNAVIVKLHQKLSALGFTDWEMGPIDDERGTQFLVVRPRSIDKDDFNNIVFLKSAPNIEGWSFLEERPSKKWTREFILNKYNKRIDASDWKFSIYKYEDGKFDVVLNTKIPIEMNMEEKRNLAIFLIVSELGEKRADDLINAIDVEEKLDELNVNAIPLKDILSYID